MNRVHQKKTLVELAEWIDKTNQPNSIYNVEHLLFGRLMDYSSIDSPFMSWWPIDQQIYFVLLVNEATK